MVSFNCQLSFHTIIPTQHPQNDYLIVGLSICVESIAASDVSDGGVDTTESVRNQPPPPFVKQSSVQSSTQDQVTTDGLCSPSASTVMSIPQSVLSTGASASQPPPQSTPQSQSQLMVLGQQVILLLALISIIASLALW